MISKSMREMLVGEGLHEIVEFEIEFMDTIPPGSKTSKTRMVISRVGRPEDGITCHKLGVRSRRLLSKV